MESRLTIEASGVGKMFNRRTIFSDITFSLGERQALGLTGRNGSGKSTLIKILAGVLSPSRGSVAMTFNGVKLGPHAFFPFIGFVSPYLQLYDEFSGMENLEFAQRIRGARSSSVRPEELLERVNLLPRKDDLVRTYSSGMKQRLKYAFALLHAPPVLFLDEPTSNLDRDGIDIVYEIIRQQKDRGIVIIAANDQEDLKLCDSLISVEQPSATLRKEKGS